MPSIHMAAFVSKNVQVSAGYLQDFKYFKKYTFKYIHIFEDIVIFYLD